MSQFKINPDAFWNAYQEIYTVRDTLESLARCLKEESEELRIYHGCGIEKICKRIENASDTVYSLEKRISNEQTVTLWISRDAEDADRDAAYYFDQKYIAEEFKKEFFSNVEKDHKDGLLKTKVEAKYDEDKDDYEYEGTLSVISLGTNYKDYLYLLGYEYDKVMFVDSKGHKVTFDANVEIGKAEFEAKIKAAMGTNGLDFYAKAEAGVSLISGKAETKIELFDGHLIVKPYIEGDFLSYGGDFTFGIKDGALVISAGASAFVGFKGGIAVDIDTSDIPYFDETVSEIRNRFWEPAGRLINDITDLINDPIGKLGEEYNHIKNIYGL